ncbi:MAG: hypothetical protein M5U26_19530 [Planctomycetota bacterium]|nr:hypothetical protein [Planctomycetota bacterium]
MARWKRTDAAFSFFSFQDLITGLSGLMIFLVLLLLIDQLVSPSSGAEKAPADPRDPRALKQKLQRLTARRERWERLPEQVIYGLVQDDPKKDVLLIECSAGRACLQSLFEKQPPRVLDERDPAEFLRRLLALLDAFPPDRHDLLLLVKASAFTHYEETVELLKAKGYRVGSEPLEEDKSALAW